MFKVFVSVQSIREIVHAITLLRFGGFLNEIHLGCTELWRVSLSRSGFLFEAGHSQTLILKCALCLYSNSFIFLHVICMSCNVLHVLSHMAFRPKYLFRFT